MFFLRFRREKYNQLSKAPKKKGRRDSWEHARELKLVQNVRKIVSILLQKGQWAGEKGCMPKKAGGRLSHKK